MAQIIKRGPSYMIRVTWRDEDGKQHKKSKSARATRDFYTYCTHIVNEYFGRAKIQSITRTKYQQFINALGTALR